MRQRAFLKCTMQTLLAFHLFGCAEQVESAWEITEPMADSDTSPDPQPSPSPAPEPSPVCLESGIAEAHARLGVMCTRMCDGSVRCMGDGWQGQLGYGGTQPQETLVRVRDLPQARSLHTMGAHNCAIDTAGGLWCWGSNSLGQIAQGELEQSLVAAQVRLPGPVDKLVRAQGDMCAQLEDGSLYCWGEYRGWCRCASSPIAQRTPQRVEGITKVRKVIAVGWAANTQAPEFCALRDDGRVDCWEKEAARVGTSRFDTASITDAVDLISYRQGACALHASGDVSCWGVSRTGMISQRTEGTKAQRISGVEGAIDIKSSYGHTCALLEEGGVRCWGGNWSGELGNGSKEGSESAVAVLGIQDATALFVAPQHTCVLRASGGLACWGSGAPTASDVPEVQGVTEYASGGSSACVIHDGGQVTCWGYEHAFGGLDDTGLAFTEPMRIQGITGARELIMRGSTGACAMLESGELTCWGIAPKDGSMSTHTTPEIVPRNTP